MTFIKEELICNRKVHMSEKSKINSLRVIQYCMQFSLNGLGSIRNVSDWATHSLDLTEQKNYK